ncbi:Nif3-like dinuclear metal center hexameric protein [Burkholderiaceae bacterium DAT-1]|nr:Nif3-like dinuclear metal center hexameric protein [Burkholderiaceae bacterium DAT-1]
MSEIVSLQAIEKYTGQLLNAGLFRDYAPNGIQVDTDRPIRRLALAVTASLEAIDAAISWGADALLVHHGYFWKGEDPRLIGPKWQRIRRLCAENVGLLAYHLPLDAHPELGNNAQLAKLLGLQEDGRFGDQAIGWMGALPVPLSLTALGQLVEAELGRMPILVGERDRMVSRIGWCSGGAQGYVLDAAAAGCEVYLTGEASERTYHDAVENGIAFIAAGHDATERLGVQALGAHLAAQFGLQVRFFASGNPF